MAYRFLIVRLSALGDVVCGLPVAVALRKSYPDAEIVWAVDPRFAGIALCCEAINHVVQVRQPREIRAFGSFDAALDLQGLLKSGAIVGACKARLKVGYHWQREGSGLFSRAVLPESTSIHIVEQYLDVARAVGADSGTARFALKPKAEDLEDMRRELGERGVDASRIESRFVILNAGAGWSTKRWPAAHFAAVANAVREQGLSAVFIGGKGAADQAAYREVVQAGAGDAVSMVGKTTVRELVALIALSRAHVGGDTGSSHVAAALGVPAIGLYSITKPERSCPYGQVERCLYDPRGLPHITPVQVMALLWEHGLQSASGFRTSVRRDWTD